MNAEAVAIIAGTILYLAGAWSGWFVRWVTEARDVRPICPYRRCGRRVDGADGIASLERGQWVVFHRTCAEDVTLDNALGEAEALIRRSHR